MMIKSVKSKNLCKSVIQTIKDKIFQPFFTTKPTGSGIALGLSLSYDIITKGHGGTIEVESTERAGLSAGALGPPPMAKADGGAKAGTEFLIILPA